jgi:hypothetical protein
MDSSNKQSPNRHSKTPGVIVQNDVSSFDILNGNQSNSSIKMININNNEGVEPFDQTSRTAGKANPLSPTTLGLD